MTAAFSLAFNSSAFDTEDRNPGIVIISPTVDTTPGVAGGFSDLRRVAISTPIIIEITVPVEPLYTVISARYFGDPGPVAIPELVYQDGKFVGAYAVSHQAPGNPFHFEIRRNGGWTGASIVFTIDAIDGDATTFVEEFTWLLPTVFVEPEEEFEVVGRNHVAWALHRLPSQFRSE